MKLANIFHALIVIAVLAAARPALGEGPIYLPGDTPKGGYIGNHMSVLNERLLFEDLLDTWDVDEVYKQKMLSGELHSDDHIQCEIETLPLGYRAHLNRREAPGRKQTAEWGIDDVVKAEMMNQFTPADAKVFSLNFMPHSYWLQFQIVNNESDSQDLVLEIDKHAFSLAHLFSFQESRVVMQRGNFVQPLDERPLRNETIAFAVLARPGLNTYFVRIDSWFIDTVPFRLWSKTAFEDHVVEKSAMMGITVGVFLFIFIYNIFIFFAVRDSSYAYLSAMTLCGLVTHLATTGVGFKFLWPQDPLLGLGLLSIFLPLSFAFFLFFCRAFIEIPKVAPKFDKAIVVLGTLFLVLALIALMTGLNPPLLLLSLLLEHVYYLPILIPIVMVMRKGNQAGLFLLIGILLHLLSSVEWFLTSVDIIPYQLINYLHIKGVSFLLLMTLGLAYKINRMKRSLAELNRDLENKVIARTRALSAKSEALLQANAKLKELDKIKTRFFTNLSHEFRTPLTLILAPLNSFLKGEYGTLSKANLYILETMKRNADNLLKLINNLLDFAKIEEDQMAIRRQNCNLSHLLSVCLSNFEAGAKSQGIHIAYSDNTNGLTAYLDPDLIEKAVTNLVANAIKFNRPSGRVDITLSQEQSQCHIVVKDTGIGIPPEHIESIFDRFEQLDGSLTRKYEGTGIGLALVKEIVGLHDGIVRVDSQLDRGSTFTITLPLKPQKLVSQGVNNGYDIPESEESVRSIAPSDSSKDGTGQTPCKSERASILIVEDNTDMAMYLAGLLGKVYRTTTSGNGLEALLRIEENNFDLILADLMMPEMDGYQLLTELRKNEQYKYLPVIFLTAKVDVPGKVEGFEKGVNDYITKPFEPEELLARIKSHLKFKTLREDLLQELKKESAKKSITETTRIKVATVKKFLNENFSEEVTRDSLALAVDMSPDHLGRSFKEIVGMQISEYLNRVRIEEASKRLREGNDKIIDIAFEVGFGNLRSFNKAFRMIIGDTPSSYRTSRRSA